MNVSTEDAARYGVTPADLRPLGAFESDVYAFEGPQGPAILKVIARSHRTADAIGAEIDWLLALGAEGVPVAQPLPSRSGRWVEELEGGESCLVAFRRAPGTVTGPGEWTEGLIEAWGELLGRLQRHSREWSPPGPRRHALAQQTYLKRAREYEGTDPRFSRAAVAILEQGCRYLGDGPDTGLIHADLHHGNLLLDQGRWTAIDFDDCAYGAYAFDLAMPLFYAVQAQRDRSPEEAAAGFLPHFLRGFRRYAPEPEGGADAIADCLAIRQAELVLALHFKLPPEKWSDRYRQMSRELRDRTVAGVPPVPVEQLRRWFEG